jgi:hypothetical protein
VAVGGMSPGAQCITLPALDPDAACGDDGRRELGFAVVGGAPGLSSGREGDPELEGEVRPVRFAIVVTSR